MKRYLPQTHRTQLLAMLVFMVLSVLALSHPNLITAQRVVPSPPPETKEERITSAALQISNRCPQPHYFRLSSDLPRFKQQTDAILIGARSTGKAEMSFDATGFKGRLTAVVECLDCKPEEGCAQDRYEVPIEIPRVNTFFKSGQTVYATGGDLKSGTLVYTPNADPKSGRVILTPRGGTGVFGDPTGFTPVGLTPHPVGIIPQGGCPAGSDRIVISMDDEDDKNKSSTSGWTGAISRYSTGTHFEFCKVDGNQFQESSGDYAVLQLGVSCPTGSVSVGRFFDNENTKNKNWSSGNIGPNCVSVVPNSEICDKTTTHPDTILRFCFFQSYGGGSGIEFPDVGVPYGVFAAPSSSWIATGIVHTDDEDNTNNDLTLLKGYAGLNFGAIVYGTDDPLTGRNTNLLVAKVRN